jgi:hypothetical protein
MTAARGDESWARLSPCTPLLHLTFATRKPLNGLAPASASKVLTSAQHAVLSFGVAMRAHAPNAPRLRAYSSSSFLGRSCANLPAAYESGSGGAANGQRR